MPDFSADQKYDPIIKKALLKAAATGPLVISPVPGTDLVAMSAIWGVMASNIAKENGVTLTKEHAGKFALGVLTGMGAYVAGARMFLYGVSKIPGIGMVFGSGVNAVANCTMTLWFAYGLVDLFDKEKGTDNLGDYVAHIIDEMRPRAVPGKIRRVGAFVRRARHAST